MPTLIVHAFWDDEANRWVATSDDIAGLATEAATMEELTTKLKAIIPELLEANGWQGDGDADLVPFELIAKRISSAPRHP